ncbi:MAG TPA: hypothetical protein VGZ01_01570 [Trinickia sp.]|jgi:hypothetical protein|nr:hypothetical protein [Trinickia sp.]
MANTTIIKRRRRLAMPGWLWFVALWGAGAGGAMLLGTVFKVFMNVTLFAVSR